VTSRSPISEQCEVWKAAEDSVSDLFLFDVHLLFQNIPGENEENFSHKGRGIFLQNCPIIFF
jgi:hypothetical protein